MPKPALMVLLVDESTFFLKAENQYLRKLPVAIREVYRADRALAVCRADHPDLIYMAYNLPDRTGAECCMEIKASPRLRHIPIVLVCDEGAEEQLRASRKAGCDAVATRPLDRKRFLELADHFLVGLGELRLRCRPPVRVLTGEHCFTANGFDISGGGIFIACKETIAPGTSIQLELLLTPPRPDNPWIACKGTVGWVNPAHRKPKPHYPPGLGVRFSRMASADRTLLKQYLLSR